MKLLFNCYLELRSEFCLVQDVPVPNTIECNRGGLAHSLTFLYPYMCFLPHLQRLGCKPKAKGLGKKQMMIVCRFCILGTHPAGLSPKTLVVLVNPLKVT